MSSLGVYSASQIEHSSLEESVMRGRVERKDEQLVLGLFPMEGRFNRPAEIWRSASRTRLDK